jgi:tyrosine-protein phosphatase non-receptor type 1
MNSVDVRNLLLEMRKYRMGLIQTADQLRFSYLAIIDGGRQILSSSGKAQLDILSDYLNVSTFVCLNAALQIQAPSLLLKFVSFG